MPSPPKQSAEDQNDGPSKRLRSSSVEEIKYLEYPLFSVDKKESIEAFDDSVIVEDSEVVFIKSVEDKVQSKKKAVNKRNGPSRNVKKKLVPKEKIAKLKEQTDRKMREKAFPAMTPEMDEVIDRALGPGDPDEQLSSSEGFHLTRVDLQTLAPKGWLNDQVINFYLTMIAERSKLEKYPSVYSFNSYFYPSIRKRGTSVVSRWTKNRDIFSYDLLFIPVHLGCHWALIVVDNRSKTLTYFNSEGRQGKPHLQRINDYLVDEMMDKKKKTLEPDAYTQKMAKEVPLQKNGSDCGIFILKYAEYTSRDAAITFSHNHMPYFRRRLVYELITKQIL